MDLIWPIYLIQKNITIFAKLYFIVQPCRDLLITKKIFYCEKIISLEPYEELDKVPPREMSNTTIIYVFVAKEFF